jgi:hypothetical protein
MVKSYVEGAFRNSKIALYTSFTSFPRESVCGCIVEREKRDLSNYSGQSSANLPWRFVCENFFMAFYHEKKKLFLWSHHDSNFHNFGRCGRGVKLKIIYVSHLWMTWFIWIVLNSYATPCCPQLVYRAHTRMTVNQKSLLIFKSSNSRVKWVNSIVTGCTYAHICKVLINFNHWRILIAKFTLGWS